MDGQLDMKGFFAQVDQMGEIFITGGSGSINVNGEIGHFFQIKKGLCQGDPVSTLLLNIVAVILMVVMNRAKEKQ